MEGLTQITINGIPHEVFFGMYAVELFAKEQEHLGEGSLMGINELASLVYAGLKNAAIRNRQPITFAFPVVYDAVEEKYYTAEGQQELTAIAAAFTDSKAVKHLGAQGEDAKKKKKAGR